MPFLKSIPADAALLDVFLRFPTSSRPLIEIHDIVLRAPDSPFSIAERELIAAFVSGLNACSYCHGIHGATAQAFGVDPSLLEALLKDLEAAPVDERLKPILRYVQKLTVTPNRMTPSDAEAVFAVGWDDRALHDAVFVCALFNFMNRMVDGLGIEAPTGYSEKSAQRLHDVGYAGLLDVLDAG